MIWEFIQMLLITIFGFDNKPKYDLHKKPSWKSQLVVKLNNWIQKYFFVIAFIAIIICLIVFIIVCFTVVGASGVESGNYYNHIKDVV